MHFPKISIVTPSYNQGRYIEQTIQSLLRQNYPNLEYVIIDGGSTDNTVEVIKKYEQHISYWVSEKDSGQADAINKGFANCTGDIFNWINSDDYYEPGTFFKLAEIFSVNPTVNVVCGKEWGFNDSNPEEKILHPGSIIKRNIFETIRVGIIDQPCTFFRRKAVDVFFPLDTSLKYAMDKELWWRYLLKYGQQNILQTNEIFTNFRLHPQSKSVGEGDQFENEYDGLRLSLFSQLHAPGILCQQVTTTKETEADWDIRIQPTDHILAAFASFYAERRYVNDELDITAQLMRLVSKWKHWKMNKTEWKLWIASVFFPSRFVMFLKKMKN